MSIAPLDRSARTFIAGHRGLVGGAVLRHFAKSGFDNVVTRSSTELDLRDAPAVEEFFAAEKPATVVMAAAKVGGIVANSTYPADFISDNLRVQVNVLDAAARHGATKLLFLGSSCIYPKMAEQPIREDSLLTGPLEETNDAYAIAKIAGVLQVQALRRQYGVHYVSAMPTNLYGPGDNFHPTNSHVLPGLIRRFHEAKVQGAPAVVVWGTGTPRREFMHVDDMARACLYLLEHYDAPEPINVGIGSDLSIRDLAELVAEVVGYEGRLEFDTSKPDGTPRKLLDVSKLHSLGFKDDIELRAGLTETYAWYEQQLAAGAVRAS